MLSTASLAAPSAAVFVLRPSILYSPQAQPRWNTFLPYHAQSHGGFISLCRRSLPIFSNSSSDPIESAPVSSQSIEKQELQREFHPEDMGCDKDFEIEVLKVEGKKNRRRIRSRVRVDAGLNSVWRVLTDYESLSNFIPGLAVNQLLEKKQNYVRLYQVGEQNLALGLKFHAKGVLECYEGELKDTSITRRRDIEFKMVEGDFKTFEGRWFIEQIVDDASEDADHLTVQEYKTTLSYVVELEPKFWLPVHLLEGRVCREIKINLICIRDEAQRIQKLGREVLTSWYTACSSTVDTETHSGSFRQEVLAEDLASLHRHNSSLPETTFKTISGASVSANASSARTGVNLNLLLSGETQQPAASFESTASFAAIPLQPVPRGSGPSNGFMSGPLERGLASGPLERGAGFMSGPLDSSVFMPGPIDSTDRNDFSAPVIYGHGKEGIKSLVRNMSGPVRSAFSRTFTKSWHGSCWMPRLILHLMTRLVWHSKDVKFKQNAPSNCADVGISELEYSNTKNLQWAHGKAGEDRVHVVLSEEQGWLFVGIYDGFSGPDAPDFLMSNLYKAIDKELEGLLWDYVDQCQESPPLAVLPSNNSLCSCSGFVGEGAMLLNSHNVVSGKQISNSQPCNVLPVERNSDEAVLSFYSEQYECGGKPVVQGGLGTEPVQGDEKVEPINFYCQHMASEVNQVQNLKLDERIAPLVCEANDLQEKNAVYAPAGNTPRKSRMGKRLSDLLQMELVEHLEEMNSKLPSDAQSESSWDSVLSFSKDSRARAHIAETQLVSCTTNIEAGSSGCIQELVCLQETEGELKKKSIDSKGQYMSSFSESGQKKKLKRSLVRFKLGKLCRKQKSLLRKLFHRSYHRHIDHHHPLEKTINPSTAVWKCKSGPIDHDAVMKAMARALETTEEAYADMVEKALDRNPELALMGSCVLVMLMKDQDVYVMNLGDSRVVLAQDKVSDPNGSTVLMKDDSKFQNRSRESLVRVELDRISEESPMCNPSSHVCSINKNREISLCKLKLRAVQLSSDHSTNIQDEVLRIKTEHVDDPQAVSNDRVKGQLKVTRAFGAEFLKQPRFNDALLEMFRVDYVGTCPYLSCEPSVVHHRLCSNDRFLVLSSDGLYEYFNNEEVISHVAWFMDNIPDGDPAQYLISELLFRAAKKNGMEFHELLDIPHGDRRKYHDDVSVMVISLEGRIWKSSG